MIQAETGFVLENAHWPVLLVDRAGMIRAYSQGARKLFGGIIEGGRGLGQTIWSRENELSLDDFLARLDRGTETGFELRFRGRDGMASGYQTQVCPFASSDENLYLLQLFSKAHSEPVVEVQAPSPTSNDAPAPPEPPLVESAVAHKQKLDCAMQLIRTVALDFNNALTSILGHASLILARAEANNPFRGSLIEIEKSAQKAAEIAHDLSDFSRQEKDTRAREAGNLNDVVRRTIDLFRGAHPDGHQWELRLEPRPYAVQFDETKIQQALVKIIENAVQAMDQPGRVQVGTKNVDLTEPTTDGNVRLHPGAYFCAEIKDTGRGIAPEVLPRIFEPFFTTKKAVGHRGLGLAWVYGIATNHGGSVAVTSDLNNGTAVRIYLPAQNKVVNDRLTDSGDLTGSQTILMIDDEELLLTMGEMILSSFGYRVLTANNGMKALEIFTARSQEIDLVITDLVMPQMSGRELIERLRKIEPEVRVICASGFVRPPSAGESDNYLQKPFASQDLLRKVKQVLESPAGSNAAA